MKFSGSSAMRSMDRIAIEVYQIPSDRLMLNAAEGVVQETEKLLGKYPGTVKIFCGSGNNGGDGIAAAGILTKHGYCVECYMVGNREKMTPDSVKMEQLLQEAGGVLLDYEPEKLSFEHCSLILDALFGTGLSRDISGKYAALIHRINESGIPVIACDIPSGICADTGKVLGTAVSAAITVTFNLPKTGQLLPPGTEYTGKLVVHDIGIPKEVQEAAQADGEYVTSDLVKAWLPKAKLESHKGDFGKLLLICGSHGFTGAAALAARSAMRSGAGLVYLGVPDSIYAILAQKLDEPVVFSLASNGNGRLGNYALPEIIERFKDKDACLFGPGIGVCRDTAEILKGLLENITCPLVLDADGLNLLQGRTELLKKVSVPVVITPHEGEFKRLGGQQDKDRISAAKAMAQETGAVVVLKGYRTVTASPDGRIYLNSTGNPGMAAGGSGDVLSGIITCLLGQGMEPAEAAAAAVFIHGSAGDICLKKYGRRGMLPSDMVEALPEVYQLLEQ